MKKVLLLGAGKSATVLINYLLTNAEKENWWITVADANEEVAKAKVGTAKNAQGIGLDIKNDLLRENTIKDADIVISMLPPALHILAAKDCIRLQKNMLTASYADNEIKQLSKEIEEKGLLFMYEMGLDPGIDHMSAMKLINEIESKGGKVTSFISHCGGLVAPESDNNPWHYKISWNPRNIVNAGKAGAIYKSKNETVSVGYEQVYAELRTLEVPSLGTLAWYPNRDSLSYAPLYGLENASTFLRTTLRYPNYILGWQKIIALGLTSEVDEYENTGTLKLHELVAQHIAKHKLQEKLNGLLAEDAVFKKQWEWFNQTGIAATFNKDKISAADILQVVLEKTLELSPADKDLIVMIHEIEYTLNKETHKTTSTLIVLGDDAMQTAMAKTVGLPLAIAAKRILSGELLLTGLHIPTLPEIYEPLLEELASLGVAFSEITE